MGTTYNTDVPAYVVDGTLTDGEAWVACATHVETGSGVTSVTLSSTTGCNNWSQYQDLVLISSMRSEYSGVIIGGTVSFNGDTTATHYRHQSIRDDGSAAFAYEQQSNSYLILLGATALANTFVSNLSRIHDINGGYCKTLSSQNSNCDNNTSWGVTLNTSIWGNVDSADVYYGVGEIQKAITSITIGTTTGFQAGTRFDLFGVLPRMVIG